MKPEEQENIPETENDNSVRGHHKFPPRFMGEDNKLDEKVLLDYCADKEVTGMFLEGIKLMYFVTPNFNFDLLTTIVEKYKSDPDLTFDEVLEFINRQITHAKDFPTKKLS